LAGVQALEALEEDDRRPPPRAALPHAPRREAAARTLEELARAHPRGHEVRVLARDREAEARCPPRLALGQRRLIAEPAQHPLLARERRRVVDAEQDLALHGDRLGPAAGGRVHVAQAAREARALGMRLPSRRARRAVRQRRQPRAPARTPANEPTSTPPAAKAPRSAAASGRLMVRPGVRWSSTPSGFRNAK